MARETSLAILANSPISVIERSPPGPAPDEAKKRRRRLPGNDGVSPLTEKETAQPHPLLKRVPLRG
jgi:hypothetical protein